MMKKPMAKKAMPKMKSNGMVKKYNEGGFAKPPKKSTPPSRSLPMKPLPTKTPTLPSMPQRPAPKMRKGGKSMKGC